MPKPGPIVLTSRTLGSTTGVSRAALDVALALYQRASVLRIRAWVPTELPAEVDGCVLQGCEWVPVSPLTAARAVASGEAPPRALLEHGKPNLHWLEHTLLPPPAAKLEVVNGLGAHALYAATHQTNPKTAAGEPGAGAARERGADAARESRSSAAGEGGAGAAGAGRRARQWRFFVGAWRAARRAAVVPAEGVPSVIVVHESPRHFDSPGRMDLAAATAALRAHDYCVFVSERGRREWQALAELDPARCRTIPNCVGEQRVKAVLVQDRAALRERFGYGEGPRFVCAGQVTQRKGQDLVLEALRAAASGSPPLQLDFLGDTRSDFARELTRRVMAAGLAERVRFLGHVADAYERIYAADGFVLGSRAEASPLVVLEAMALGTCVIAPDVDGVAEQLIDGESGLLFPREDVPRLAQHLQRVASDPALRARLATAAQARYAEHFSRNRQLERWGEALATWLA
ncbi:MAG: glycosyltransferase family 4 protein [Polyangiales bacterium]